MDPSTFDLLEGLARLSGAALAFLIVVLLMRGALVTKLRFDDASASCDRLLAEKDREIARLIEDRDWWKEATVTALQIGETVAGRSKGKP